MIEIFTNTIEILLSGLVYGFALTAGVIIALKIFERGEKK